MVRPKVIASCPPGKVEEIVLDETAPLWCLLSLSKMIPLPVQKGRLKVKNLGKWGGINVGMWWHRTFWGTAGVAIRNSLKGNTLTWEVHFGMDVWNTPRSRFKILWSLQMNGIHREWALLVLGIVRAFGQAKCLQDGQETALHICSPTRRTFRPSPKNEEGVRMTKDWWGRSDRKREVWSFVFDRWWGPSRYDIAISEQHLVKQNVFQNSFHSLFPWCFFRSAADKQ